MLNIVIPMAGRGSRFASKGYLDPKPLIPVHGIPMIKIVIDNLRPKYTNHRFIFICQRDHVRNYELKERFQVWAPGSVVVELEGVTDGAASTVLKAREFIDNQDQLMIANSDQYVNINVDTYLYKIYEEKLDGLIMTMTAHDPKWSFVSLDSDGFVNKVVEKDVISDEATVGIYNFSRGQDFVRGADMMIAANRKSNGEFYVAPVYNELVNAGSRVGIYNIGAEADGMYGLGIPEDLEFFLSHPVSAKIKELASC